MLAGDIPFVGWPQIVKKHIVQNVLQFHKINIVIQEIFEQLECRVITALLVKIGVHSYQVDDEMQQKTVPHLPLSNPSKGNGAYPGSVVTAPFFAVHTYTRP